MARDKLSPLKVKNLVKPGRYGDGAGLWLQVRDKDHRSWLFRYVAAGKPRQMGLGHLADVSLAEARETRDECRRLLRQGLDPIEQRRERKAAAKPVEAPTFKTVAERYVKAHEAGWRNEKHGAQWTATLTNYAFPVFGDKPINKVDTGLVMEVLEPIWREKSETASRVRGRIESVLDYAAARGWRSGDNPARWRGHLDNLLPKKSKVAKVEHHAALPWSEIGAFMVTLRAQQSTAALALQFTVLTASRTSEALGARWPEIDMAAKVWTVPGERMKSGREHRVPLSGAAVLLLEKIRPLSNGAGFVFPGGKAGKPLSGMSMAMLLRRMDRGDLTVHGFRSTFRDWCGEATNHPREIAEAALAHALKDKVEAAYQRGDMLTKRARLMAEWAAFCAQPAAREVVAPDVEHSTDANARERQ